MQARILRTDNGAPTRTGKPGKWEGVFRSGNFEQTGKSQGKAHKILENEKITDKYYLIFLVYVKYFRVFDF